MGLFDNNVRPSDVMAVQESSGSGWRRYNNAKCSGPRCPASFYDARFIMFKLPWLISLLLLLTATATAQTPHEAMTDTAREPSDTTAPAPEDATDWREQADARIERVRKGDFRIRLVDTQGKPMGGGTVNLEQTRSTFQFGTAVGGNLEGDNFNEKKYRDFILKHFNSLVCENAMKWYATERERGTLSYDAADQAMRFAQEHALTMRGHCLFWGKERYIQDWIQGLNDEELRAEMEQRLSEIVPRYAGQLIAWDVNNEMLDGHFYENRLGAAIRVWMFKRAHELDPTVPLFVNDYSLLGNTGRTQAFIEQIRSLQADGAVVGGIGIQEHGAQQFHPTGADAHRPGVIYDSLEELAPLGLPIHLTEISVQSEDEQRKAESLEVLLREAFSHPSVKSIHMWGFWRKRHWKPAAALVEEDWTLLPAGEIYEKLVLQEWRTRMDEVAANERGEVAFRGFYGDYRITTTGADGESVLVGTVTLDEAEPQESRPTLDVVMQPAGVSTPATQPE